MLTKLSLQQIQVQERVEPITLVIYGIPVAQGRPRISTRGGFAKAYDPAKSRDYKDYVRMAAVEKMPGKPLDVPLSVKMTMYMPMPKSMSKKKVADALNSVLRPTTKPDCTNLAKGIEDALNGVLWRDDSLIVDLYVSKFYSDTPRVEITVSEV